MKELTSRRTLVELYGTERVLVECHKGIRAYGTEQVSVGTSYGLLTITGRELRLCCMSREQVFIRGDISGVTLVREGS